MNKELKTINVTLIGCGDEATTLTASDTATDPQATYALDEFGKKDQMHFTNDGKTYYVPFHAVDHIEVEKNTTTVPDRPDPYGCYGGETVTYIFHTDCPNTPQNSGTPDPIIANKGETITMPTIRTTGEARLWTDSCDNVGTGEFEGAEVTIPNDSPSTVDWYFRHPLI